MTHLTQVSAACPSDQALTPHWVIILAAGLSTRLGHPKQLLTKNGQPLIGYMTELALTTQPQGVMVVVPKHHPNIYQPLQAFIEQTLPAKEVQMVFNPTPETGMALSLSLAIDALKCRLAPSTTRLDNHDPPSVLIMSIDQIRLSRSLLLQLVQSMQSSNSALCASHYQDVVGLPLVIKGSQLLKWKPHLSGDKGLRQLIRALPADAISLIEAPELADDIDTPEELAFAQSQGWLD